MIDKAYQFGVYFLEMASYRKKTAFTLVELLVVVAIISLLIALVVPIVGKAMESARVTACAANMRNLGQALFMYSLDHNEHLPKYDDGTNIWDEYLLPYLGNDYQTFLCPDDPYVDKAMLGNHPRSYAVNGGQTYETGDLPFGAFNGQEPLTMSELHTLSGRVILIGERPGDDKANRGYVGAFPFCTLDVIPGTVHRNGKGANYCFGDMSVQYVEAEEINQGNYWYCNVP